MGWDSGSQAWGGAAAAAAGGGASFTDMAFTDIDLTDGTWLLYDPASIVDTTYGTNGVTHSTNFNTVQLKAKTASANYTWLNGSTVEAPRYYKLLAVDGTQVTAATRANMLYRLESDMSVNDYSRSLVLGTCTAPTSTTAATVAAVGVSFDIVSTSSNGVYGAFVNNGRTGQSSSKNDDPYGIGISYRGQGSTGAQGVTTYRSDTEVSVAAGSRSNRLTSLTGNVYLVVGVGTARQGDAISEGDQIKFRAGFIAMTLEAAT